MRSAADLRIGGLARLSTCDWPGQLVATIFAQGCPWDCPYCHNPDLLTAGEGALSWGEVIAFLETRVGLLDGVVFSGGEPTAQAAVTEAIQAVRDIGMTVGLHTGGPLPDRLAAVLPNLSWVGLDIKAPFADYEHVTRVAGSGDRALQSLRLLVASGAPFEARTTVHPDLLDAEALSRMADELATEGVRQWVVQAYRRTGVREGLLGASTLTEEDIPIRARSRFESFTFREA